MEFEEVKPEQAFLEPDGFYAHLNNNKCKVVLLRLPKDYDLSRLEGQVIKAPRSRSKDKTSRKKGIPLGNDVDHELHRANSEATAGLLVPGVKGLKVQRVEEMWTVIAKGPQAVDKVSLEGQELNFDQDVVAKVGARKQPDGLRMNLSAVDISSVLDLKKKSTRIKDASPKKAKKPKARQS